MISCCCRQRSGLCRRRRFQWPRTRFMNEEQCQPGTSRECPGKWLSFCRCLIFNIASINYDTEVFSHPKIFKDSRLPSAPFYNLSFLFSQFSVLKVMMKSQKKRRRLLTIMRNLNLSQPSLTAPGRCFFFSMLWR